MAETVLNRRPHPRILVCVASKYLSEQTEFLLEYDGTIEVVHDFDEVDLAEWDLVVTDRKLGDADPDGVERLVDLGPNIIYLLDAGPEQPHLIDYVTEDGDDDLVKGVVFRSKHVPGREVRLPDGLPASLRGLAQKDLARAADKRLTQFGIEAQWNNEENAFYNSYRPFLLGPKGIALAGSYMRDWGDQVWVLPTDLPNLQPWVDSALREWHDSDPESFPSQPKWIESPQWRTVEEKNVAQALAAEIEAFARASEEHAKRRASLETQLEAARVSADDGERRLLFDQDLTLQDAVLEGLRELGFEVQDMDQVWEKREPREDYRITDPGIEGWLAIGDATGLKGGVSGGKVMKLGGYTQKYLLEERPAAAPD